MGLIDHDIEITSHFNLIGEDLVYIFREMKKSGDKSIEIIDISKEDIKGEVIKTYNDIEDYTQLVTDFFGSSYSGTTFNKLIVVGDKLEKYQSHQIKDELINEVAYNKEKKEWVIVGQNKIHYIPTDANQVKESFEKYAEAIELLEIGFKEGVDILKQSLAELPSTFLAKNNGKFLNTEYDLTLKERAELVLAEYNSLMAGDSINIIDINAEFIISPMGYKIKSISNYSDLTSYPEVKKGAVITAVNAKAIIPGRDITDYYSSFKPGEKITLTIQQNGVNKHYEIKLLLDMIDNYDLLYAHRKLFEYGLLSVRAGYPQLNLQAAQEIKNLKFMYPNDLLWDKVNNHIILLEALAIAARDGTEAGFKHMLDNDGILNDDNNKNYIMNIYLDDYPEYFAPLLADSKKMAYFTSITENELPSAQIWQPEKLDFIDLSGNEIAGVEANIVDSFKNEVEDNKNSNSLGTVSD